MLKPAAYCAVAQIATILAQIEAQRAKLVRRRSILYTFQPSLALVVVVVVVAD